MLINTTILPNLVRIKNKILGLWKINNKLVNYLSIKTKGKKTSYSLNTCFLRNKKISGNIIQKKQLTSFNKTLISHSSARYGACGNKRTKNYKFLDKKIQSVLLQKNNTSFIHYRFNKNQSGFLLNGVNPLLTANRILHALHVSQTYFLPHASRPSLSRKLSRLTNKKIISYKIKSNIPLAIQTKNNYLPIKKQTNKNNLLSESVNYHKIKKSNKKNKTILNTETNRQLLTKQYAAMLIKNIYYLNTTVKETHFSENFISRVQEHQNNNLIKLDKQLSYIKENMETLLHINQQKEIHNSALNLFNEKRKKTYSDYL